MRVRSFRGGSIEVVDSLLHRRLEFWWRGWQLGGGLQGRQEVGKTAMSKFDSEGVGEGFSLMKRRHRWVLIESALRRRWT